LLAAVLTHHEPVIFDFIAQELGRKVRDKFNFPESEVRQLRRFLRRMATAVAPTVVPTISRFSLRPSQPAHWS
jgi:hypothetical protein